MLPKVNQRLEDSHRHPRDALTGSLGVNDDSREFDLGIGALPVTLGRAPTKTDNPPYHLTLDANDSTLSREHVRIESKGGKKFEIVCMSKNGAVVNKVKIFMRRERLWLTIPRSA